MFSAIFIEFQLFYSLFRFIPELVSTRPNCLKLIVTTFIFHIPWKQFYWHVIQIRQYCIYQAFWYLYANPLLQMKEIKYELSARNTHHTLLTGQDLEHLPDRLLHPHVVHLKEKQLVLQDKIQALKQREAYRPYTSQKKQTSYVCMSNLWTGGVLFSGVL